MPTLVRAIDVSSHQPRNLRGIITQNGAEHVVVKLYLPEEVIDQGYSGAQIESARAAGCTVGGYIWCYRDLDPRKSVRDGVELARSSGLDLPMLWLGCESYTDAHGRVLDPGPDADWLRAAIDECRQLGARPGLRTGFWWVRDHFPGGSTAFAEFSELPLWLADYDGVADVKFRAPFAGFTRLHGKQYSADGIDLDVFLEECCSRMTPARTLEQLVADNPTLRQQLADWQRARIESGQNPNDYAAFRQPLVALGAPDRGEGEFIGVAGGPAV